MLTLLSVLCAVSYNSAVLCSSDRKRFLSSIVKLDCGYRVDLLVDARIVVELEAVETIAPVHEAIVLRYLRLSGCNIGLLINFNVAVLKGGIGRFKF